ncbi:MAG: hypothetical protein WBG17_09640 [Burkholderiaceae bacterium]
MLVARKRLIVALLLAAGAGAAGAKLPPPTPEQQQQEAQKKAQAAAEAKEQQEALTRVQDRIAADYIAAQKAKGVTVTPTPLTAEQASKEPSKEVPSAALESRPTEKSGAYNEQVSPQSAQTSAAEGSSPKADQNKK